MNNRLDQSLSSTKYHSNVVMLSAFSLHHNKRFTVYKKMVKKIRAFPVSLNRMPQMFFKKFSRYCFLTTYSVLGNDYFTSMDVRKHESCTLNKLSLLIRIDNFPSFVTSKAHHCTRDIIVNNTRWFIILDMRKYCQTSAKYICINDETSDQPESLGASINGKGEKSIDCSFDVVAKFKFKQPHPLDDENEFTKKFCFNSSNGYTVSSGFGDLAMINVIFTFFVFLILKSTLFHIYCALKSYSALNKMG